MTLRCFVASLEGYVVIALNLSNALLESVQFILKIPSGYSKAL